MVLEDDIDLKEGSSQFVAEQAVKAGNFTEVQALLLQDTACHTLNLTKLLVTAAAKGHLEIVQLLLLLSTKQQDVPTALALALEAAALNGHLPLVRVLVKEGADYVVKKTRKTTALMSAAWGGSFPVVEYFVKERGVDVNEANVKGSTALMMAVDKGHENVVAFLLDTGCCQLDAQDINQETALHIAVAKGHANIAHCLMDHGANVNLLTAYRWTVLMMASQNWKLSDDWVLMERLASLTEHKDFGDLDGITALSLASFNGNVAAVDVLLNCGCNVNHQDLDQSSHVMYASESGQRVILERFLACPDFRKELIEAAAKNGRTPLMCASHRGHLDVVKLLVSNGARNVNSADQKGWTALMLAAHFGHLAIVNFLVESDLACDVDKRSNEGWTALMIAARKGHLPVVEYLIEEAKAKVNECDNEGCTALHMATLPAVKESLNRHCKDN